MLLTDELGNKIAAFIPAPKRAANGGGRPACARREVLEGILWVLSSGARWKDLPSHYPGYKTCHRLFQEWQKQGVFEEIFYALSPQGSFSSLGFIDGTFIPAKKGAHWWAGVTKAREAPSWPSVMGLASLLDLAFTEPISMRLSV